VKEYMRRFWEKEKKLLNIIFGTIETNEKILKNSAKGKFVLNNHLFLERNMIALEILN